MTSGHAEFLSLVVLTGFEKVAFPISELLNPWDSFFISFLY